MRPERWAGNKGGRKVCPSFLFRKELLSLLGGATQGLTLDLRVWRSARSFWILKVMTELGPKLGKVQQTPLGADVVLGGQDR